MSDLEGAITELKEAYARKNPRSATRHHLARSSMPGGNTRTTLFYDPFPLVFGGAAGATLTSIDGDDYTDFLSDFTAGLYGHSHPEIVKTLHETVESGLTLGGYNDYEAEFAHELCKRFPSLDLVRFTNSGTEANLMALAAAIAGTGRDAVVVFRGGYHGGVLAFLDGLSPTNAPYDFHIAEYNDPEGATTLIRELGDSLAAVLVEPMLGSGGCIPADREFLQNLRTETTRTGALLIFDEVMTSRLSFGGMQQRCNIEPDLTTLGKYLGGGMSFGAFGGREELMQRFDPSRAGAWAHPGTFNNNVLTMAAGLAGLQRVLTEDALHELNERGDRLRKSLTSVFERAGAPLRVTGLGSMLTIHPLTGIVHSRADLERSRESVRELLFFHLLTDGFWLARRTMVALNLSITDDDCDALVASVRRFVDRYGDILV